MRRLPPCGWCCFAVVWTAAAQMAAHVAAAEAFPYDARVVAAGAAVRSGPGDSYYLTDTLAEDQVVEVHQQRPDGWCAIRPPEASFSWVFARHVEQIGDGLGRINKDDVASRVGSRLSGRRDTAQVRLDHGEVVRIVGEGKHGDEAWYKIAPPAGEFRWIHVSSIRHEGAAADTQSTSPTANAEWRPSSMANGQPEHLSSSVEDGGVHLASIAAEGTSPGGNQSARTPADLPAATAAQPQPSGGPTGELAQQLAGVELRLSRMVAQPATTWNVAELRQETEQLLARANAEDERSLVKATLAKMDQFAAVEARYKLATGNQRIATGGTASGATAATTNGGPAAGQAGQFDAVGVLRPVVSRRAGAPQYALVDQQGQVVSFVTPTPGVNLQPYLGRRIGVVGSRGYMPEFRRSHVTAGRVSPLNDTIVR